MQVGFLTACMGKNSLQECVELASTLGFDALEVHMGHLPAETAIGETAQVKDLFAQHGVAISAIAAYGNWLDGEREDAIAGLKAYVDASEALGLDVLCALTGMPVEGKSKEQCLAEDFKQVFAPVAEYAQDKGIKLAFENYFRTLIQNFQHWDAMLEAVPLDNMGFNYDPSHLIWQDIDYLAGVDRYADRIFHTHAKDTEIRHDLRAEIGNQDMSWWRYVIPGFGSIDWGRYIARLRNAGYDGILSIEHEDGTFTPQEGLQKGLKNLRMYA
jgi:sugar phosphate isomerase/epimerase